MLAPTRAAVLVEGHHVDQSGDPLAVERTHSGKYAKSDSVSCYPTPGTERRRSSFSRHTGLCWSTAFILAAQGPV